MDKMLDSFLPPKSSKLHLSLLGLQSVFLESVGAVVTKTILSLKNF